MTTSTKNGLMLAFNCFRAALGVLFLYSTVTSPTILGRTSFLFLGIGQFVPVSVYFLRRYKLSSSEGALDSTGHTLPDSE